MNKRIGHETEDGEIDETVEDLKNDLHDYIKERHKSSLCDCCKTPKKDQIILTCNHSVNRSCLSKKYDLKKKLYCPICRKVAWVENESGNTETNHKQYTKDSKQKQFDSFGGTYNKNKSFKNYDGNNQNSKYNGVDKPTKRKRSRWDSGSNEINEESSLAKLSRKSEHSETKKSSSNTLNKSSPRHISQSKSSKTLINTNSDTVPLISESNKSNYKKYDSYSDKSIEKVIPYNMEGMYDIEKQQLLKFYRLAVDKGVMKMPKEFKNDFSKKSKNKTPESHKSKKSTSNDIKRKRSRSKDYKDKKHTPNYNKNNSPHIKRNSHSKRSHSKDHKDKKRSPFQGKGHSTEISRKRKSPSHEKKKGINYKPKRSKSPYDYNRKKSNSSDKHSRHKSKHSYSHRSKFSPQKQNYSPYNLKRSPHKINQSPHKSSYSPHKHSFSPTKHSLSSKSHSKHINPIKPEFKSTFVEEYVEPLKQEVIKIDKISENESNTHFEEKLLKDKQSETVVKHENIEEINKEYVKNTVNESHSNVVEKIDSISHEICNQLSPSTTIQPTLNQQTISRPSSVLSGQSKSVIDSVHSKSNDNYNNINLLHVIYSKMYNASLKMKEYDVNSEEHNTAYQEYCDNYNEYQRLYTTFESSINLDNIQEEKNVRTPTNSSPNSELQNPEKLEEDQAEIIETPISPKYDETCDKSHQDKTLYSETNGKLDHNQIGFLWLSNLCSDTKAHDICDLFKKYGHVSKVKIFEYKHPTSSSFFGLVCMTNYSDAEVAMTGLQDTQFLDQILSIKMLQNNPLPSADDGYSKKCIGNNNNCDNISNNTESVENKITVTLDNDDKSNND